VILEALISVAIIIGAAFVLVGSIGLIRLNDLYSRLHGPTKSTTLGLGAMLVASVMYFTRVDGDLSLHELLVTIFLFLTAPASAHMVARAGLHHGVRSVTRPPSDREAFPETAAGAGSAASDDDG
jgi:multicomponent K+:H+ antiporter subunit G